MVSTGAPERGARDKALVGPFLGKAGRWDRAKVTQALGIALARSRWETRDGRSLRRRSHLGQASRERCGVAKKWC
jgi:hypothetical protein